MPSGIFVSYRREDSRHAAGRLVDRLTKAHGRERLFMDVDGIEPGADFVKVIDEKLSSCSVMLAVIGPHWLGARDQNGWRRLDSASDFVRIEIESALTRGVRLIPVLVDGATMPRAEDLPPTMQPLVRRNAVRLTHESFGADADRLATALGGSVDLGQPTVGQLVSTAKPMLDVDALLGIVARVLVLIAQIGAAVVLAPMLKSHFSGWRQYDIFQYVIIHTVIAACIGRLASTVWRHAPVMGTGSTVVMLFFAATFAGVTVVPEFIRVIEVAQPHLRGQRWLYPLAGAITGYLLMSSSMSRRRD